MTTANMATHVKVYDVNDISIQSWASLEVREFWSDCCTEMKDLSANDAKLVPLVSGRCWDVVWPEALWQQQWASEALELRWKSLRQSHVGTVCSSWHVTSLNTCCAFQEGVL